MKNFDFISDYSSNDAKRIKLYRLFEQVFGIPEDTLHDFYQRGFWNPTYRPFTYFDGDLAIANASMFTLSLIINKELKQAAGIQSVMTHPDYRRQGLMTQLMKKMLKEIDERFELSFLLTSKPYLYEPFGFRVIPQHYFVASFVHPPIQKHASVRKLDFFAQEDLQIVQSLFINHHPVSNHFAPIAYQSSFYLNMYNPDHHRKLYYSEDLNVMIVFEADGQTLKLYDVIGETIPTLDRLCMQIPYSFTQVEFYFSPDLFDIDEYQAVELKKGNQLMVRGHLPIENIYIKWPVTAEF